MRALARAGWEVLGADDRRLPWGLQSRYAVGDYHELPPEENPALSGALLELLDRLRPDVLIPTRGAECASLHQAAVQQRTHALLPDPAAFALMNNKSALLGLCGELGVPAPRVLNADEAIKQLRANNVQRVVVKPCRDVGGGEGVHIVTDATRVAEIEAQVMGAYGDALITEYVPGQTSDLRAVHLLFDAHSRLVAHFVVQKLRLWPRRVGVTVCGISTHEPWLARQLLPIFHALKWRGPADAELKIDARDGQAKLLEINPRFSGVLHFPIECGVNFPLLYCRAALGERLDEDLHPHYPAGAHYLAAARWLTSVGAELCSPGEAGRRVLGDALMRELRAPRVCSVHEATDPAPILGRALLALQTKFRPRS
jgi:predicted ATP-grasp superfamily ATP-dependent carboligase